MSKWIILRGEGTTQQRKTWTWLVSFMNKKCVLNTVFMIGAWIVTVLPLWEKKYNRLFWHWINDILFCVFCPLLRQVWSTFGEAKATKPHFKSTPIFFIWNSFGLVINNLFSISRPLSFTNNIFSFFFSFIFIQHRHHREKKNKKQKTLF